MNLVHGANSSPNIEALVLGAPLVVLGLSLFLRKNTNAFAPFVLIGAGAILSIGSFTFLYRDPHPATAQGAGASPSAGGGAYAEAVDGLCLAQMAAAEQNAFDAQTLFQDRAHAALHEIADAVGTKDRGLEGDLLVAMQRVESDFAKPGSTLLADRFGDLIDATDAALDALGIPAGGCVL